LAKTIQKTNNEIQLITDKEACIKQVTLQ